MKIQPNSCAVAVGAIAVFLNIILMTNAGCVWNGKCLLQCINSNTTNVITEIEDVYARDEECHSDGVYLRLRTLTYPNNTIGSNWFTANVTVKELDVYLNYVVGVSGDAFNAYAFRTVKKLTLQTFELSVVEKKIFNGLDQLQTIEIKSANGVNKIEAGVLDSLTELQTFNFEEALRRNPELNINGLTGASALPKLEHVKIKYNLSDSLKRSTLIGLTAVKRLDLSSCQIQTIGDNAFDPISETIEQLDLSGNALTTISYGVFSMVLPAIKTIEMNGNSLRCDCDLYSFRLFVERYQDNFKEVMCSSPTECMISNVLESDCFADCETPTTTEAVATTTTTWAITTTTTAPDTKTVECRNELAIPNTVSVKRPIGYMTTTEHENGDVNLHIENERNDDSLVVIWFEEQRKSGEIGEEISCITKNERTSIPITGLRNNAVYSFCLMDKNSNNVSPFDCISYAKRDANFAWLYESSKALTIGLIVVGVTVSVFVGIGIGFWIMKFSPFSRENHQISSADSGNGFKNDRMSTITDTTYTTASVSQYDQLECPALPERPPKFSEEPVYASIYAER